MKLRAHPNLKLPLAAVLALALLAAALPAAAQTLRDDDLATAAPGTSLIAIHARVTDLDTRQRQSYLIEPDNEGPVPLRVGDRVLVEILGTAIRRSDGVGIAVEVPVRFEVASGSQRIDVAASDDNSVIVRARQPDEAGRGHVLSALAYTLVGNYDVKPAMRDGRVTFTIDPLGVGQQPSRPSTADARWREAVEIADALAYIRLDADPLERTYVEWIYRDGYDGIREVASRLAAEVALGETLESWEKDDLLARLYRHLLGRPGGEQRIADDDPEGFRNNLRLLDREGYQELVRRMVDSDEFRRVHELEDFEDLPRDDRVLTGRPLLRDTRPGG